MNNPEFMVYRVRQLATGMLPVEGSNIPLDICLLVAFHHRMGKTLTMKGLTHGLPYSEAGIQYNLRELEKDNWIEVRKCAKDRRVRRLHPAKKLEEAISAYWETIVEMVDLARRDPDLLLPEAKAPSPQQPFLKPPSQLWDCQSPRSRLP